MSAQLHTNPLSAAGRNRRLVLEALCQLSAPADRKRIADLAGGVDENTVGVHLVAMTKEGLVERIDQPKGKAAHWQLVGSVRSLTPIAARPTTPAATDGEPGDGSPDEDHEDEETAAAADPDDYGDDEIPPAAAYDATVEAEAKADEAPLIGEDVNSDADVLGGWCADHEMAISPRPVRGDDVAMIVSADGSVSADMPALRFAPPATGAAVASGPCPTVALLIQRASPVTEEAAQRAIDTAEAEALLREKEANIALDMAVAARVRGRAVAELIRFAEQRTGLAGDADPSAVLYAIDELLGQARSAVTGMSRPA